MNPAQEAQKQRTLQDLIEQLRVWICDSNENESEEARFDERGDRITHQLNYVFQVAGIRLGEHRVGLGTEDFILALIANPQNLLLEAINRGRQIGAPSRNETARHLSTILIELMEKEDLEPGTRPAIRGFLAQSSRHLSTIQRQGSFQYEMQVMLEAAATDTPPVSPPAPAMSHLVLSRSSLFLSQGVDEEEARIRRESARENANNGTRRWGPGNCRG